MGPSMIRYVLYRKGGMVDRGATLPTDLKVFAIIVCVTTLLLVGFVVASEVFH